MTKRQGGPNPPNPTNITGTSGAAGFKSVLDTLTPQMLASLTPEAKKTLSQVPVNIVPNLSEGGIELGGIARPKNILGLNFNAPGAIDLNPRALGSDVPNHEALHELDFSGNNPFLPNQRSNTIQTSQATREQIAKSYYATGVKNPNVGSESHIPSAELFAQAGMNGYWNIPPEMRGLYRNIFMNNLPGGRGAGTPAPASTKGGIPARGTFYGSQIERPMPVGPIGKLRNYV